MNLSDIKSRHAHIENQERTQSVELLSERRSKSHRDRAWLIEELERALGQNEKLGAELAKLGEAVAALEAKSAETEVTEKAPAKGVRRGKKKAGEA